MTWLFMAALPTRSVCFGTTCFQAGSSRTRPWRVAAYPFGLMVLAEAYVHTGPKVFGFHPGIDVIAALIAVVIDWIVMSPDDHRSYPAWRHTAPPRPTWERSGRRLARAKRTNARAATRGRDTRF